MKHPIGRGTKVYLHLVNRESPNEAVLRAGPARLLRVREDLPFSHIPACRLRIAGCERRGGVFYTRVDIDQQVQLVMNCDRPICEASRIACICDLFGRAGPIDIIITCCQHSTSRLGITPTKWPTSSDLPSLAASGPRMTCWPTISSYPPSLQRSSTANPSHQPKALAGSARPLFNFRYPRYAGAL